MENSAEILDTYILCHDDMEEIFSEDVACENSNPLDLLINYQEALDDE